MKFKYLCSFCFLTLLAVSCTSNAGNLKNKDFYVKITNSKVQLALSEKADFVTTSNNLAIESAGPFQENSYPNLPKAEVLDDENVPYDYGKYIANGNTPVYQYFKYTFYVGNIGKKPAQYDLNVNLFNTKTDDGTRRSLINTLRVMVFENDVEANTHNFEIFAKESAESHYDKDGNLTRREFVATRPQTDKEDDEHPLATSFESNSVAVSYKRNDFKENQKTRYTIVFWLEGEDPDSSFDAEVPVGESIKLSVDITAYEMD